MTKIYATDDLLAEMQRKSAVNQLASVLRLPYVVTPVIGMPELAKGYGVPTGMVVATRYPNGPIIPSGIGFDINCGVRLLRSTITFSDIQPFVEKLADYLFAQIPPTIGHSFSAKLGVEKMDDVLNRGALAAVDNGFGNYSDLDFTQSHGGFTDADPSHISDSAKKKSRDELGSLGTENHSIEVCAVDLLSNTKIAKAFGLSHNLIVVLIHTGSRNLGHQVQFDAMRIHMQTATRYNMFIDKALFGIPLTSREGKDYYTTVAAVANFAFANRQMLTFEVRKAWSNIFGNRGDSLRLLYDHAHNLARVEKYIVEGRMEKALVHRNGASCALGPSASELPADYQTTGQPVCVLGTMGGPSYILAATDKTMTDTFGSLCHGAGRTISRRGARKRFHGEELAEQLRQKHILIETELTPFLAEEAPQAFHDLNTIVAPVVEAGLATLVAQIRPLVVIKGSHKRTRIAKEAQ